ncbi:MAG: putative 7-carboxy-7-deazaguanine synthase [Prokaryotic dsDNA virus sp.]|jgi:organic radical activating enzyme|nr:MAG: putative 7-carboxy-7-deazaguanine synthase [Prokaryotic dsDNA virus sp.]|tara:strand:+ start:3712 stop:4320 length:609 start_codon:yes stop_codon:yes gene_type:complete
MKVNEIFKSIQGEGRFAGTPVLFVRLSGCNRSCRFCDTKYHIENDNHSVEDMAGFINDSRMNIVVWTGGEPLLQIKDIKKVIELTKTKIHHLETNGDKLFKGDKLYEVFNYICCSPKSVLTTRRIHKHKAFYLGRLDMKIISSGRDFASEMLTYADYVMPLTTNNDISNDEIKKTVWMYCVMYDKKFCLRQHVEVWGNKKGV